MHRHRAPWIVIGMSALISAAAAQQPPAPAAPAATPSIQPAAPATPPAAPAVRMGFCDVVGLSSRLVMTEPYAKPIQAKQAEITSRVKPLEDGLKVTMEQLRKVDPQPGVRPIDPEKAASLRDLFNSQQREYTSVSQKAAAEFAQFVAQRNGEAYRQVAAAIDVVAERRGYAVVIAVRSIEELKNAEAPPAFIQCVLARPAVRYPASDDITAEVAKELKLPDPPQAGSAGTPPAPAAAPGPVPAGK